MAKSYDIGKQSAGSSSIPIYDLALEAIKRWNLPPKAKVIDVGGGRGNLAVFLVDRFQNVEIVDHAMQPAPAGCIYRTSDLNSQWELAEADYDAAFALEVIEHLENPRHFARELARIIKPGGRAFISTPNQLSLASKTSLFARDYFRDFSDNCYPAHITALLPKDLERIAIETGFLMERISFTRSGRVPCLSCNWQRYFPFLGGKWFSDNLGVDWVRAR